MEFSAHFRSEIISMESPTFADLFVRSTTHIFIQIRPMTGIFTVQIKKLNEDESRLSIHS